MLTLSIKRSKVILPNHAFEILTQMRDLFSIIFQKARVIIISIFITFLFLSNGYGQISFAPYQIYPTGSRPEVVCIGDVNNDGLNDVILGTQAYGGSINDYKIFVYLQNLSGNLSTPVLYSYPSISPGITSMEIADVNNDNLNDIIIGFSDDIGILYQNIFGTFNPITTFFSGVASDPSIGQIVLLSVGDLNNDGLNDIAVLHAGLPQISVCYQNISGGFTIVIFPYGGGVQIKVADLNNDHLKDIVFIKAAGLGILLQDTLGNLGSYSVINIPSVSAGGMDIGDLNNDGVNDIAFSKSSNYPNSKIVLLLQDTVLNHFDTIMKPFNNDPDPIRISDLNCDGRNEIILACGNQLMTYEQNINNIYTTYLSFPLPYATHTDAQGISVGDINNDHRKEVVQANYNSGLVVLTNQSTLLGNCCNGPPVPSKPNGDTIICQDNITSVYKPLVPYSGNILWHLFPMQAGSIIISNQDSCQIIWNNAWHGNAKIYISITNSCSTTYSDTLNVFVNRIYPIHLGNDVNLCTSDTIVLNVGNYYYTTLLWQNNSSDSILTVTTGGTYFVESSNVCGISSDTIFVQSVPLPHINLPNDTTLCSGTFMHFNVTLSGNNNYLWQDNSTNPVYITNNSGIYSVIITDSNNCQNHHSITVSGLSAPDVYLPHDTILCDTIDLTFNLTCNGCNYLWQDSSSNPVYSITQEGQYTVTISNFCGTIIDTINVGLDQIPVMNLPSDTILCSGISIHFNVSLPGNNNYLWQDNSTSPVYTVNSPGVYSVTITDSSNCQNHQSVSVSGLASPYVYLPHDTVFCDTIDLVLNLNCNGCNYLWQDSSTDSVYSITQEGQYMVTISNFCGTIKDTVNVGLIPLPVINLPPDTSFCKGDLFILDVTQSGSFPFHYLWQDESTSSLYFVTAGGNYTITISDSNLCQVDKTITVQELTIPLINFPADTSICIGVPYILNAFYPGSTYLWQDGNTSAQYFIQDSGIFFVIVTDKCGFTSDSTKISLIDCSSHLDVPSAFSPNDDGINDILFAVGNNVENVKFLIYDRWGKKVFKSEELSVGWDGKFNGVSLDANVFMYHISATSTANGQLIQKEGSVSLLR